VDRINVDCADDNAFYACADDCISAGRRSTSGRAWFQGHVKAGIARNFAAKILKAFNLAVRQTGASMMAAGNDFFVCDQNGSNGRVRAGLSDRFPRFDQSAPHKKFVGKIVPHATSIERLSSRRNLSFLPYF